MIKTNIKLVLTGYYGNIWKSIKKPVNVDLNPIRADICHSLEGSDYTSVKQ